MQLDLKKNNYLVKVAGIYEWVHIDADPKSNLDLADINMFCLMLD